MEPTRRELLTQGAGLGATAALLGPTAVVAAARDRTAHAPAPVLARGGRFAQGVMAGQPNLRAVTLWTQLTQPEQPGPLEVEVAEDATFARVLHRQAAPVDAATGVARLRVRSRRLAPGRRYAYRFRTADGDSGVGYFKTLRPADSAEPVRIGVFSCQMSGGVPPTAFGLPPGMTSRIGRRASRTAARRPRG